MKKVFTLLLLIAATLSASAQPYIVGHRGSIWGVENTEEAFINGAKKGYDYLETDIKVTKDGHFVCWHDDNLTKASDSPSIASNTLATLQSKKLTQTRDGVTYTGYLTTFERYLDICKEYGVKPLVEFKWATGVNNSDCSNIPKIVKILEEKGFRNDCYIFTSMETCLKYVKTNYPDMEIMKLVYSESFESYRSWCKTNNAHIGSGTGSEITKAGIQAYHDAGLLVNIWTVNSNSSYQSYGNMGADFITTDELDANNLPALSTPTTMTGSLKADKSELSIAASLGQSNYADITITGSNMSSGVTVTCDNSLFKITNNTSFSSGKISGSIRVTFTPTSEGITTGTITLKATNKSGNTVTTTVKVTGKCSLIFDEVWNFSETSGKAPATGSNWASDKTAMRNIAYGNGKLYTINPGATTITVVNAQTGAYITSLNTTGISGGTYGVMDAQVVDGKLVATSLATSGDPTVKAYVWDTDNSAPREILNTTQLGGCSRVGDCMSIQGNLTNGAIIFLSGSTILKYAISNGVVSTIPNTISVTENGSAVDAGTSPRVIAQADGKFWIIGRAIYPKLVSASGNVEVTIDSDVLNGIIDGNDFYPFTFKGKQYAFATTYATGSSTVTACRAVLIDASNGWANAVNVGEYPAEGLGTTRNTNLNTGIEVDVNGEAGVEMWVNCSLQGIAHYRYGAAKIHTSDPTLSVSQSSLNFETTDNASVTQDITVTGINLKNNITLTLSGANASQFSVSPASINQSNGSANATVTVTYSPTALSLNHTATLTIASNGATSKTVALSGKNEDKPVISGFNLTQEWAQTSGHLTANSQTRWATAFDGKIYINDHENSQLYYWNNNGLYNTGIATAAGTAITSDTYGNIIISTSMYTAGCTALKILPKGGSAFQDLTVTLPSGVTANQMQYLGQAIGNVMSSEGGAIYIFPKDATAVAKIVIKNGAQSSASTINVNAITADAQSIAVPLTQDINSDEIAARVRAGRYFYVADGSTFVAQEHENVNTTAGGTYFTLQNTLFAVEPIGDAYRDGFQVVNNATGDIVATHTAQFSEYACAPNANCLVAEIIDEWNARIYQYVPGQLAAQYLFEIKHTSGIEDVALKAAEKMSVVSNGSSLAVNGVDAAAIAIYSINGTLVASAMNSNEIEVEGLNGLYIVAVTDANGQNHVAKAIIR